ncbi:MAG: Smr/MutS family protein [Myxococcota bacterium]
MGDHARDPESSIDEATLFRRAMAGVVPLAHQKRLESTKTMRTAPPTPARNFEHEYFAITAGDFELEDDGVRGRAPGVSHKVLRKLGQGSMNHRRRVDLHGCTREEAHDTLRHFIVTARREGERCVLVVTGRGLSSPGGISVLRETLPQWLSRSSLTEHVLAFCPAQPADGGSGAFYVLLRR